MKSDKQILYPSLFKRLISATMDMLVISLIFGPFLSWINTKIFLGKYGKILTEHDVDIRDSEAITKLFMQPDVVKHFSMYDALEVGIPMIIIYILTLAFYFIGSWHFIGATPMKYMLSMRIVDEETLEKPRLFNLIWRFIGYSLFIFGIWFIFFTKRNQALHDKMGNCVVIKS